MERFSCEKLWSRILQSYKKIYLWFYDSFVDKLDNHHIYIVINWMRKKMSTKSSMDEILYVILANMRLEIIKEHPK